MPRKKKSAKTPVRKPKKKTPAKLKIEVGKTYITRDGSECDIIHIFDKDSTAPYPVRGNVRDKSGYPYEDLGYTRSGRYVGDDEDHHFDLMCEKVLTKEVREGVNTFIDDLTKPQSPKDGDRITNENGAHQSFLSANYEAVEPEFLHLLAQGLGFGARKYGLRNWKGIPVSDNLSHAMNHITQYRLGDKSELHLANAAMRLMFAICLEIEAGNMPKDYIHPDMNKQ
jgi:hypothetical protein